MSVCAYACICEEDAVWITQFQAEADRLAMPYVIYLDGCSVGTRKRFHEHRLCVRVTTSGIPRPEFDETVKQHPFDEVVREGYDWAMSWDVDETYERDAENKIREIRKTDADYVDVRWLNLWGSPDRIRMDGVFAGGHRVKFYNLKTYRWKFDHKITNGAKAVDRKGDPVGDRARGVKHDLVCLHWGMMTRELREMHKARWDRIYTAAVGANPYGFWDYALNEETNPPVTAPHEYLPK